MIELVTQAYMLMAPVGVLVAVYCAARLLEARDPKWLDGGGGIRGKPLTVPLSSLRFPTAPTGVVRSGGYSGAAIVDPAKVRPPRSVGTQAYISDGTIFIAKTPGKPTVDPSGMTSIMTCKEIDW